ncbi:HNH endonuclease [Candidatus Dojkabacteria bacterium]|jgi:ribonucleotide reductase alpha subunit|nr:HNH endonuclease [Candidatus Dojkabacteria bacterium]
MIKKYSREEVFKKTLEYFKGDELATNVWINKYALKDSDGNIYELSPEDMHHRLAKEIYRIEKNYPNPLSEEEIFESIKDFKYIVPQGSPMSGIGNDFQISSISNCFVVGQQKDKNGNYEDSYGSILKTDQEIIQLCKRRAGVGTTLEYIRPCGSSVKNAALTSTGVVPFMTRYSNSIKEVAQCLHGDTKILTKNGIKEIKNVIAGDFIWTSKGFIRNNKTLKNQKSLLKMTTKFGNEIICSEDHIFNTTHGEKALKDLKINDEINIIGGNGWIGKQTKLDIPNYIKSEYNNSNRLLELTLPEIMSTDLSYFLGYSYGDGYVSTSLDRISLSLSNDWIDITHKLKHIIKSEFKYDSRIINKEKYGKYCIMNINSKLLVNYLKHNNILKQKSKNIILPNFLYNANAEIIFSFISGYFDAYGTISEKKKTYKLSSINKEFLLNIQRILYSFGIISKIHTSFRTNENWETIYNLTINGQKNQHLFYDLMKDSVKINSVNKFYKNSDNLRTIFKCADFNTKSSRHSYIINNEQYLSYSITDRLNEDISDKNNQRIVPHVFQDYIFSIEHYDDLSIVYDLSLDSEHLFYANGFQVHNSGRRGALMLSTHIKAIDSKSFIDAKLDTNQITGANISVKIDDEFIECLKNNKKYQQQFPLNVNNPSIIKEVDPKEIWNKLIFNNWKSAEPGILFWDTIIRESVPDCYKDFGFESIGTNPCVVGDTLIAVADGRNAVSIKQLAEEGKDVPVYTINDNNELCIKTMRNPRITGYNQKIYKVTIEGGHSFRVTGNHIFILKNGTKIDAKNLKNGDSLKIMTKYENKFRKSNTYYNLRVGQQCIGEHRLIAEFYRGAQLLENEVVHHKDYNGLNNNPENLQIMTKEEHDKLHSIDMIGDLNPYHKMSDEWKFNFASHPGETNPNYVNISNDNLLILGINLTKKLNHRLSIEEWQTYAKENNLPQCFTNFREKELGNLMIFLKHCAEISDIEFIHDDPRLVETYKKMLKLGYNCKIENHQVLVEKTCEICNEKFWIEHRKREISFCSSNCSNIYLNTDKNIKEKRTNSINDVYSKKMEDIKNKQLDIFTKLRFDLNRTPMLTEWENACEEINLSHRLNTKYGFNNFKDLKENAEYYNHKVISVVEDGFENVYNGTVDDTHQYFMCDKSLKINVLVENCGEIILCDADSCRLLLLNLFSFVDNPFTKTAKFNFDKFKKYVFIAQRYMDDIVDLELEKIDQILEKIKTDPESEKTKAIELDLWNRIRTKCESGRRTGTGVTAEGDMLAALGLIYGTTQATEFAIKVHQILALNAYKSSVNLAKERGCFDIFNFELEKNNPFVNRLYELDTELKELTQQYGRRNIGLLTISPAGTTSIMTQTSSGIEPVFLPWYTRRSRINQAEKDRGVQIDFIDENGEEWREFNVFHHKFLLWAKINNYVIDENSSKEYLQDLIKKSPYYKASSADINWKESINMQGQIQKYIDHSISKTVNLPSETTVEIVDELYRYAHEVGCKGVTIYRDGSRSGVLVSNEEKPAQAAVENLYNNAPKRPKIVKCDILRFQNNKEKWIGFVGLLNGKPYEIFTGLYDSFQVPSFVEDGWIKKVKEIKKDEDGKDMKYSRYDFVYLDKDGIEQELRGLSRAFDREYWNYGKLMSGILRHGMPIPNVISLIDSLSLKGDTIVSWKSGIKRMLKKYVKDDEIVNGENCPQCGSSELRFESGCVTCPNCGYSRCG